MSKLIVIWLSLSSVCNFLFVCVSVISVLGTCCLSWSWVCAAVSLSTSQRAARRFNISSNWSCWVLRLWCSATAPSSRPMSGRRSSTLNTYKSWISSHSFMWYFCTWTFQISTFTTAHFRSKYGTQHRLILSSYLYLSPSSILSYLKEDKDKSEVSVGRLSSLLSWHSSFQEDWKIPLMLELPFFNKWSHHPSLPI